MAFAPFPAGIIKKCRSLQRNFLWGAEGEGSRKIAWIKWSELCKTKKEGGLGIKNIKWFNLACLAKWCWRLLTDRDSLWSKVLRSRYGENVGTREIGDGTSSRGSECGWWGAVLKAVRRSCGDWFFPRLRRFVGDGRQCSFWEDSWNNSLPLKVRFPRLFHLSRNKAGLVKDMGRWCGDKWVGGRDAEAETEINSWLAGIKLSRDAPDGWSWNDRDTSAFSVKMAYSFLETSHRSVSLPQTDRSLFNLLWKATAPLKHKLVAWRSLKDKLPTRDNLSRRIHIPDGGTLCTCCGNSVETAEHFFLHCRQVDLLWRSVTRWMGVVGALPGCIGSHFAYFSNLLRGKKARRIVSAIWICVISCLWYWRNRFVFHNQAWDFRKIEVEIKTRFWSWGIAFGWWDSSSSFTAWSNRDLFEIV